jgi:hypothetical protein
MFTEPPGGIGPAPMRQAPSEVVGNKNGAASDTFVARRSSADSVFSWNTNEDVVNSRSSNGDLAQRADQ